MGKTEKEAFKFGLVGRHISYSFSKGYFSRKFAALHLENYSYENFDLPDISDFPALREQHPDLKGVNVTIPYKESVIPYLDELDPGAAAIGAVNTIHFSQGKAIGYNTDVYGFQQAITPMLRPWHTRALILGTGGASKAVAFVLRELHIAPVFVSRNPNPGQVPYAALNSELLERHTLLINTTPLGTFPNIEDKPPIPYHCLTSRHLLFDLIYNPGKTAFLAAGEARGAQISNGLRMLELQAEKAWEIWNA